MNSIVTRIKQFRPAAIIAMLALFVAVGGTATAASGLINGAKIKNNTVAGKKLKNKTITPKKLAPKTIKTLKGKPGPQGEQGPKGDPGIVSPTFTEAGSLNIPANTEFGLATASVPAGKYMVTANVAIATNATDVVSCSLSGNNGGGSVTSVYDNNGGGRTTIPIQMVTETSEVTSVTLGCHAGNQVAGVSGNILAVPVQ